MTYLQGFIIPVKEGDKQAYLDLATKAVSTLEWKDVEPVK